MLAVYTAKVFNCNGTAADGRSFSLLLFYISNTFFAEMWPFAPFLSKISEIHTISLTYRAVASCVGMEDINENKSSISFPVVSFSVKPNSKTGIFR